MPSEAITPGTASNFAAGMVLSLVWPVGGVSPQSAVNDSAGFNVGRDLDPVEAWWPRILQRIRKRGQAGSMPDYEGWAQDAGAASVKVLPRWVGAGTVGVAVLMAGPRVASDAELARIDANIQLNRPVTATAITLAGSLSPTAISLAFSPTASARAPVRKPRSPGSSPARAQSGASASGCAAGGCSGAGALTCRASTRSISASAAAGRASA